MNTTQVTRIEILAKVHDSRAAGLMHSFKNSVEDSITEIKTTDVYTVDKSFTKKELSSIASLLTNPVSQEYTIDADLPPYKADYIIEIGYLPGVTDNIANTAQEIIQDAFKQSFATDEHIYYSYKIYLTGSLTLDQVHTLSKALYNPVIQSCTITVPAKLKKGQPVPYHVPRVSLKQKRAVDIVDLSLNDEELRILGKQGIPDKDGSRRGPLALDLPFLHTIRDYFHRKKRNPTDIELESLAQTWSEHCKHTIFADPIDDIPAGLFKTYIKKATDVVRKKKGKNDFCISVFTDNSGGIEFDKKTIVTHKVETHNSPSALDPFGGAITGIVGVNRDTLGFGMGAKPVINVYGFCFAPPYIKRQLFKDAQKAVPMLSPRRIMDGVIAGVNSGGNCSGIPTPSGFLFFHDRYQGKPLVFVGTIGLIPKKIAGKNSFEKKAKPGDYIVMTGGRVGLDGIHGATFSSEALNSGSPSTAVQIGDPITQKKMSDALVKEARDLQLYSSITDNGAGGLSCSVAEMAKESGGCLVDLDKVPLKYPGLAPWQIWISESQERMTLAVPKRKWKKLHALLQSRGVEATRIGTFTASGKCIVKYHHKTIMNIDMDFLHNGLPERSLKSEPPPPLVRIPLHFAERDMSQLCLQLLNQPNQASAEFISTQFDHEVQGSSILKPLQGRGRVVADATVTRPLLTSKKGIVLANGLFPTYAEIDPYQMAAYAIDTAVRNAVSAGADIRKIALLDNFCWCDALNPVRLFQLKEALKACFDLATTYATPFISGKDSMFNDFKGYDADGKPVSISIPPTLLISAIGVIDDIDQTVSLDAKMPGDEVYLFGKTMPGLAGTEIEALLGKLDKKTYRETVIPPVQCKDNLKLYRLFHSANKNNLIASAQSVGRGGLITALAKTVMGGRLGMQLHLKDNNLSLPDELFSESQGRIVVTVNPVLSPAFKRHFQTIPFTKLGVVSEKPELVIVRHKSPVIQVSISQMLDAYRRPFKEF